MDEFLEAGIVTVLTREHLRGFELGYEACMQVMKGVMKATLTDATLIDKGSRLRDIENQEVPESGRGLAVAMHIASDRQTFSALMKERSKPLGSNVVKLLLKELEETEGLPNPLSALAGYRNKPPQWN